MICSKCKSYLPNAGKFCPHCGEEIQKEIKENVVTKQYEQNNVYKDGKINEADNYTNLTIEDTPYVIPMEKVSNSKRIYKKIAIFAIGTLIVAGVFYLLHEKSANRLLGQNANDEIGEVQVTTGQSTSALATEGAIDELTQVADVNTGKIFAVENGCVLVRMPVQYTEKTIYADDSVEQYEVQFQYDDIGRCIGYTGTGTSNDDESILDSMQCSYDESGRVKKKTFDETYGNLNEVRELEYSYGEGYNLFDVTESYVNSNGGEATKMRLYNHDDGLLLGEYTFDDEGNVKTYEEEDNILAQYWYDEQNRITSESIKDYSLGEDMDHFEITNHIRYNNEGLISEDDEYSYQYDENNHLISLSESNGIINFSWNGNQLEQISINNDGNEAYMDISYDEEGDLNSITCEDFEDGIINLQEYYTITYETFRVPLEGWQYYLEQYYYYQRINNPRQDMDNMLPRIIMPLLDGYYQQMTIYHNFYMELCDEYSNYEIYYRLINRTILKK